MVENIGYFGRAHAQGGLAGIGVSFYVRVILGSLGHSLYTGATGAGLGYAREANTMRAKIAAPVLGYCCAILLHALWNGTSVLMDASGLQVSLLVELLVVLPAMTLFLTYLQDEVTRGTILKGELAILGNWRERFRRTMRAFTTKGPRGWADLRRLYELEVDLAFRKWHVSRGERLMSFQQVLSEDEYRERIAQVRGELSTMGISTE